MNINLISLSPNKEQAQELALRILSNMDTVTPCDSIEMLADSIIHSQCWASRDDSGSIKALVRFSVMSEEIYIFDIHVFGEKDSGTGSALMKLMTELADLLGKRFVRLRCNVKNRACGFYRKLGFQEVGQDADLLRFQLQIR